MKLVFIRTTTYDFWSPSTAFLSSLRQRGHALFVPGPQDMRMPHPSVTICIPSSYPVSSSLTQLASHSRLFNPDYHDSVEGGFGSPAFIGDISKDGRILPPSGMF